VNSLLRQLGFNLIPKIGEQLLTTRQGGSKKLPNDVFWREGPKIEDEKEIEGNRGK